MNIYKQQEDNILYVFSYRVINQKQQKKKQKMQESILRQKKIYRSSKIDQQQIWLICVKDIFKQTQIKKKYLFFIYQLFQQINLKVLIQLNTKKLNFEKYPQLYSKLDLDQYKIDEWSLFLDEQKQSILKYITMFDEKMAQQPKKEPVDENIYKISLEPKIGGLSISETSQIIKYLYFGTIFSIIAFIIYYGYKQTDQNIKVKGQKDKKKDKKKD
ncbi:hypothetical protein IMG5_105490 [Ichthyophthirius multifiliis]|uniref:Transmembrane protein n=1 Tax=Ichthyophthirius multifiliis TaxID=5932 RepID=G0QT20_ICHMU|nr:hypothetical protein IMG5_105490 [Ichthyophthirius multifiliis]EGR31637.1 hypothetical protein IMG5_105490 [Ichthyophthirius multifiliis]|eukprot:XP_004035123.1 hypothetical protein IMG5_105490 [Ichthyophthirius multifiliis]